MNVYSCVIDFFLKKVKNRVRATGIKLNLTPQALVKIILYAEQVVLINVLAHELVSERVVEVVV